MVTTSTAGNFASGTISPSAARELRGREIAKKGGIKQVGSRYAVPSQSGSSSGYIVDLVEESCSCLDYEMRRKSCKHVHGVYFWLVWGSEVNSDGSTTETVTVKRKTYPRDWRSYTAAQVNEGIYVERMLRALCDGIEQPARKAGPGRPPIPLKDAAFSAIAKVYSLKSQRRAQSDLCDSVTNGNLARVSHINAISNFLGDEASTQILISLIEESAKPLAALENGQFAIDSTGFSTVTYDRWFDQQHGKLRASHPWVKLHIAAGTVTHAITAVKVSPEGDCPQLPDLVAQTMKNFSVQELSADKAYASKDNFETLDRFGVEAFIPFKINATLDPKCETWSRHLGEFLFNQATFLPHYHRRSNVETVMWMLKSKLGATVRSKTPTAQMNEVLAKCLLHNLTCVVQAIFTAGLTPKFWQDASPTGRPSLALVP